MRAWLLHIVFAAILVGSLAAKDRKIDVLMESNILELAVKEVAYSYGLVFRDYVRIADADIRALAFDAPGCTQPVLVVLQLVSFDQEEQVARSYHEPGYEVRHVYIGGSWDKVDRLAVFTQRVKYAVLASFGLSPYVPSPYLLMVRSPAKCAIVDSIDWRIAWRRDHLAAIRTNREATTVDVRVR
jgi:hypothetical protein